MAERAHELATRGLGWPVWLMGWIPGLLQFRTGWTNRAVAALVSCTVLYFVGWWVFRDRLFYLGLYWPDRDSSLLPVLKFLPVTLLPESLNLPAAAVGTLLAFEPGFEAERAWRLPRDFEHAFGWLSAASGMLAAFWSADGHWLVRLRRDGVADAAARGASPAAAAAWSWLVPGLGHVRAGQRDKGLLLGGAVLAVFVTGMLLGQGHAVDRGTASIWWIGQNLFGGGTLFAALVTAPMQMTSAPLYHQDGVVLCTVAGFMNLVVMIDAYTVTERAVLAAARTPAPPVGAAAEAVR
jgi:hypothetical protein